MTHQRHVNNAHSTETAKSKAKGKCKFQGMLSLTINYFVCFDANNRDELARMVEVENLSFNFGENVGFINYYQRALNPSASCVPRLTLTRILFNLYKKDLVKFFLNFDGRVSYVLIYGVIIDIYILT